MTSYLPFLTAGEIARRAGVPVSRVQYVVLARHLTPAFRAGRFRMFDPEQVAAILDALRGGLPPAGGPVPPTASA